MPSPETRKNFMAFGALIVPVLVVKLTTIVLGQPSVRQASAELKPAIAAPVAPTSTTKKPTAFTPQQIAAMNYISTLRSQPFGPAPIRAEKAVATITQPVVEFKDETPVTIADGGVPQFIVTAVMSTSGIVSGPDGNVAVQPTRRALINGRPYREGEMIKGTTWKIATIDCNKRSVRLRDTQSDRVVTATVELPQ